jgi:hypothetical protein
VRSLLALVLLLSPSAAEAKVKNYLLVIGENKSLSSEVEPLRYADDDAAKNWEMFSLFADRTSLFVVLDDETARVHREAAAAAEVPEKSAIMKRLAEYDAEMQRDRDQGDEPELFLLYAGHGDVDETGEGYVTLHDGKLTRSQLYGEIIGPSKAKFVHVVVDACKSYFLVKSRGGPWKDDRVEDDRSDKKIADLLASDALDEHPRAGVIVATSGDQQTHEWSQYQSGILSHELRSALSGAADVNGDRRIEYSEVRAFLAAANAAVKNPDIRLDTFSRAPALDRHRPLIDLARLDPDRSKVLRFSPAMVGRYSIEDERGVRYADVHKDVGTSFDLPVSNAKTYYVKRNGAEELVIDPGDPARIELERASWSRVTIAARGAVEKSFRQDLYRVPYGRRFYDGFVATSGDLPVEGGFSEELALETEETERENRIGIGYSLAAAPAGGGLSHAFDLRYQRRFGWIAVGATGQVGYGEQIFRAALMPSIAFEIAPIDALVIAFDLAFGWQLLSGTVQVDGRTLEGTEPRGLRGELGAGLAWRITDSILLLARGGAALDGIYAEPAQSTAIHPFGQIGVAFEL